MLDPTILSQSQYTSKNKLVASITELGPANNLYETYFLSGSLLSGTIIFLHTTGITNLGIFFSGNNAL